MRTVVIVCLLLTLVGPAASLTFGPPVRAHCPVDDTAVDVRILKSRLHHPIALGGPALEPFYECPACHFAGAADDFRIDEAPSASGAWSFPERTVAAAWLASPAARALPLPARSARLAAVLTRSPVERGRRFALAAAFEPDLARAAALWRETERALRGVADHGADVTRAVILERLGDPAAAAVLDDGAAPVLGTRLPTH